MSNQEKPVRDWLMLIPDKEFRERALLNYDKPESLEWSRRLGYPQNVKSIDAALMNAFRWSSDPSLNWYNYHNDLRAGKIKPLTTDLIPTFKVFN